ncbi:MAG: 4-oxalomesaconate tautomerase [Rhodospirillaceae bacterium]|nr:4-oxalomesaconate tautomerase [Rhodospirillaceae bacterium]
MAKQTRIPCVLMRGGTSKGAYFLAADMPRDIAARDRVLLAAMGSPDPRQIDGVGGAHPLTSKVAIVSPAAGADADVDYLFAQVTVDKAKVDVAPTCGNILAGIGPFAIEQGLVKAEDGETRVRIFMVNTKSLCTATVKTPGGEVAYDGDTAISGVPGTAAPILLDFENTAGSSCGALLPTGRVRDEIEGVAVTCIDNGMPVVVMAARDVGATGYESPAELNSNAEVKRRIEAIRLKAGPMMRLGDVSGKVVPKMTLVAPPREGGALATRTFIPHVCHEAIGVLGAVSVATACVLGGSATEGIAAVPAGDAKIVSVEHPTGEFTVQLETEGSGGNIQVTRAALLRTARRLFEGNVLVPRAVWDGR